MRGEDVFVMLFRSFVNPTPVYIVYSLIIQVIVSPGIWRSRRNYKEGVLFGLASVAIALVTAAWVTVYVLCTGANQSVISQLRLFYCSQVLEVK